MNIAEVCFVRQNALLMVFQRIYCRVNTVWPPLLFGLLHPHYHTSDRIIGGVHMFYRHREAHYGGSQKKEEETTQPI